MRRIIDQILNIFVILAMAFFAMPKLLGKPRSIAEFEQFEKVIGIDADFFRIFTGIAELGMASMILVFTINKNKNLGKIAYAFLLITMITALALEFFVRPEPKNMLVILAIILTSISGYKLNLTK